MSELLPCPFCDGEPEMTSANGEHWVRCTDCGATCQMRGTEKRAVIRWNRRPAPVEDEWQDGERGQYAEPPALDLDTKYWFWTPDVHGSDGFINLGSWFERPWRRSFKFKPATLPTPPVAKGNGND
jgi:hypothetical protein